MVHLPRRRLRRAPQQIPPGYAQGLRELYEAEVAFLDRRLGELVMGVVLVCQYALLVAALHRARR